MNNNWLTVSGLPMMVITAPAFATDYLTVEQAQVAIFPEAVQFLDHRILLSEKQKNAIKSLSGKKQRWDEQRVWQALDTNQNVIGWFVVDNVVGKHEFITYGLGISASGEVTGIEIMSYRETHGDEVREASWRQQFEGKTIDDPFKLNNDIPNISGATLSARNVTDGVKRLLALHQVVLKHD
jgi:Na+-translocating ferredoxin:NAD+ oxidoreductase RnfG subunit